MRLGVYLISAIFSGCFLTTAQAQPMHASLPPLTSVQPGTPQYYSPIDVKDCAVGTLPGEFSVDQLGQANYDIPLAVPPGTADLSPELSLHYSSQLGDGHFGVGMTLTGLSVIGRCRKSLLEESDFGAVTNTQQDVFCLDGDKLILNGTNPYGSDGAIYQTNPDTMVKVVSVGQLINPGPFGFDVTSPKYFLVYHPDGTVYEYGGNDVSSEGRIMTGVIGEGIARAWAVSKIYDRFGNFISFSWSQSPDGGEFWLDNIDYTGRCNIVKNSQGLPVSCNTVVRTPYNRVQLSYQARQTCVDQYGTTYPCNQYGYQGGLTVETTLEATYIKFLGEIDSTPKLYHYYKLSYENSYTSNRSRVRTIEWCSKDNICLPATKLFWSDYNGYGGSATSIGETTWGTGLGGYTSISGRRKFSAQFGFDLGSAIGIGIGALVGGPAGAISAAVGGIGAIFQKNSSFVRYGVNVQAGVTASVTWFYVHGDWLQAVLGDFNGDGKTDLGRIYQVQGESSNRIRFYTSNGSQVVDAGVDAATNAFDLDMMKTGDFDGDGRADFLGMSYYQGVPENTFVWLSTDSGLVNQNWGNGMGDPLNYAVTDVDGDGTSDLVKFSAIGDPDGPARVYIASPQGEQFIDIGEWGPSDLGSIGLNNLIDLNGDGRSDIVKFDAGTGTMATYINTGSDFVNAWNGCQNSDFSGDCISLCKFNVLTASGGCAWPNTASAMLPGDFNGDGFTDVVIFEPHYAGVPPALGLPDLSFVDLSNARTFLSNGRGQLVEDSRWAIGIDTYAIKDSIFQQEQLLARVVDMNGDGFSDIISFRQDSNKTAWVMYSRGNGFESRIPWGYGFGEIGEITLGDFDGDGRSDIARFPDNSTEAMLVSLSKALPIPDQLVFIKDGQEKYTRITYDSIANTPNNPSVYSGNTSLAGHEFGTRQFQVPLYVVSSYSEPVVGVGDGPEFKVDCSYSGSKFNQSRGWLGFEQVNCAFDQAYADPPDVKWSQKYNQIFPKKGLLAKQELFSTIAPFYTIEFNSYDYDNYARFNSRAARMYTHQEILRDPMTNGIVRLGTDSFIYDEWDNVLTAQTTSILSGAKTSVGANYTNDPDRWVFGLPEMISETFFAVSGNPLHNRATSLVWNVDKAFLDSYQQDWMDGQASKQLTYAMQPDSSGNVKEITVGGNDIASRTSKFDFEANGRFLKNFTNPLNHTVSLNFDPRSGEPTRLADPNGLVSESYYDSFERNVAVRFPDGHTMQANLCAVDPGGPALNFAGYKRFTKFKEDGYGATVVVSDFKDRVLRTVRDSHNLKKVYQDYIYGSNGQLSSVTEPRLVNEPIYSTNYSYDAFERLISTTRPDGSIETMAYSSPSALTANPVAPLQVSYGSDITVTNSIGLATIFSLNDRGDVSQIRKKDAQSGTLLTMSSYNYDSEGRLTKVADSDGLISQMTYGAAGANLAFNEPNMGLTSFTADSLGQTTSMTDAMNRTITYEYDLLDRLKQRFEPDSSGTPQLTKFIYDRQKKGLLAAVQSAIRTEIYDYDALSRPKTETIRTNGQTDKIKFDYDRYSRLEFLTYPGSSFAVQYVYSPEGYLETVADKASGNLFWYLADLTARGQQAKVFYGDGLYTDYGYSPTTGALETIQTYKASSPLNKIQDFIYVSDTEGRLTQRFDARFSNMEAFGYDKLDRLTAEYLCLIPQAPCNFASHFFTYASNGNLLTANYGTFSSNYTYDYSPVHPNAVAGLTSPSTSIGYTYDTVGNLISDGTTTLTWTAFNKPEVVTFPTGDTISFSYDYNYDKVTQITSQPQEQITYIDEIYERRVSAAGGTMEYRNIFVPGGLAAAVVTDSTGTKRRFIRQDSLGSTDVVTDITGNPIERYRFGAFGEELAPLNWSQPNQPPLWFTSAGFTGHELLKNLDMIDMGGRIYNPTSRQFISADPYVTEPNTPLGLNRYSYVENSPTNLVDPSGFGIGGSGMKWNRNSMGGGHRPSNRSLGLIAGARIVFNSIGNSIATMSSAFRYHPNVQMTSSSKSSSTKRGKKSGTSISMSTGGDGGRDKAGETFKAETERRSFKRLAEEMKELPGKMRRLLRRGYGWTAEWIWIYLDIESTAALNFNRARSGRMWPKMLTAQRELNEKERIKAQGIIKARRNQEADTHDVEQKTKNSEKARREKQMRRQVIDNRPYPPRRPQP